MEKPIVYLSKAFLQKMEECEPLFRAKRGKPEIGEFIPAELKSLERIFVLLSASTLLTDYNDQEAVKLYKKASAGRIPDSYGELVVHQAIKGDRLQYCTPAFTRYKQADGTINAVELAKQTQYKNAVYLLAANHAECEEAMDKHGVCAAGINFDFLDFYRSCTVSNYATSSELEVVEQIAQKGNGLVIIDKYILTDAPNRPDKIPHIVATIKKFMAKKLEGKFELTIITQHIENDRLTQAKACRILEDLGGKEKVSFKLIACNRLQESDRYMLANYLSISVGHPWDRDSVLSSSSNVSQESKGKILEALKLWTSKLKLAKNVMFETRPIPNGAFVFATDDTTHRLLNLH